jgi:hypothetical protein
MLTQAGVSETDAMQVSGHRSRAVFERYNIRTADDQRAALVRAAEFRKAEAAKPGRAGSLHSFTTHPANSLGN